VFAHIDFVRADIMRFIYLALPTVAIAVPSAAVAERPTLDEYKESQKKERDEKDTADANQSKMAAVDKVVSLLEDLHAQVLSEGEKEAHSYEKFACFCKDMTAEKQDAIQSGEDDKDSLSTKVTELSDKREKLDDKIKEKIDDIATAEGRMKDATRERKKTEKIYEGDAADLNGAVKAVRNAINVMKQSKKPSFVEMQSVSDTIRHVGGLAEALGYVDASMQKAVSMFLQQNPDVPMENYKFHGGNVIDMLEKLQGKFRDMKNRVDEAEVESMRKYDKYMQEKTNYVKATSLQLAGAKHDKAITSKNIITASEKLTTSASVLLDDQQYMSDLATICSDKAQTWDQRSRVRADEISALTSAIVIIKGTVSEKTASATVRLAQRGVSVRMAQQMAGNEQFLEAVEQAAEEADTKHTRTKAISFLQRTTKHNPQFADPQFTDEGRRAVIAILDAQGKSLKSSLFMSLATQIAADPLAKVKTLIQELIERLLHEAAAEGDQKGFCDKSQAEAKGKRTRAAEKVEDLNSRLDENEAIRDKLNNQIEILESDMEELESKKKEAISMRAEEKAENGETVEQAHTGLDAVSQAIDIIDKFYKTAAKEDVDLELLQKGPEDDMPDSGFDAGEAYKGGQGESTGVLGMLDVIKSDFERTITETEKAEEQSEEDHFDFLTYTGKSLAKKEVAVEQKTKQKDNALQEIEDDGDSLKSQIQLLQSSIQELLDLKPACVDTGMSYEERVSRREDEIEGLKKALCIFNSYAEYGPDAVGRC